MMTRIQFALMFTASLFVLLALAYLVDDTVERRQSLELHKCREFILYKGDTVEVIYTKHEYRHFRKMADPNYVETRFTNP